jgi:glycine/D-amino acid oxidase-like deaminating enzyme
VTRVVVVGAGLLGSAVAYHLSRLGVTVTVLDAGRPAGGTSGSTFAWANAQDKSPDAYLRLNVDGQREYATLAGSLGTDWYHPGGDLLLGAGPAADKVHDKIERHRAVGYPVEELDRAALAALEPSLDPPDGDLVVAHFTSEAWIAVPLLVGRLLEAARAAGAVVRSGCPVDGFDVIGDRIDAVRIGSERVPADLVVLAAGPASEQQAALAGVELPMAPSPGLLVVTEPLATGLRHIVHTGDGAFRPDGGGRVLVSSRAVDATLDPDLRSLDPAAPEVADVVERTAQILPAVRGARVESVRIGVRSVPTDGQPAIGFTESIANLYTVVTHSGVTLGALVGRLVASELSGESVPELEPYRPTRFAAAPA